MNAARLAVVEASGAILLLAPRASAEATAAFMNHVPAVTRLAYDGNYQRSPDNDPEDEARRSLGVAVTLFRDDLGVTPTAPELPNI